jgi:hypothetical protein
VGPFRTPGKLHVSGRNLNRRSRRAQADIRLREAHEAGTFIYAITALIVAGTKS